MGWIVGLALAVIVVGWFFWARHHRARQAEAAAEAVGGNVVVGGSLLTTSPQSGFASGVGARNPAVPPPALVPDQMKGVASSGPPVRLTVCGLPALAWQRDDVAEQYTYQGMRLSLIIDCGVGLPVLQMFHRSGVWQQFAGTHGPSGIAALDERFRIAGDVEAWRPLLSMPVVQQSLLRYPLETFSVLGGRLTFVSTDGVHLDPNSTSSIAWVAATIISTIPPEITSAAATPPPTAMMGPDPTNVDSVVAGVLAKSNLSPEQQQAMLALINANRHTS